VDADGAYVKSKWGRCDEECLVEGKGHYQAWKDHEKDDEWEKDKDEYQGWKDDDKHDRDKKGRNGLRGDIEVRGKSRGDHDDHDHDGDKKGRKGLRGDAAGRGKTRGDHDDHDGVEVKKNAGSDNRVQSRNDDGDTLPTAGVIVAVFATVCLLFCCFTAGVAFLAFRLGRKDRELRTLDAMSPNLPLPHVTGAPIVEAQAFTDHKEQKLSI